MGLILLLVLALLFLGVLPTYGYSRTWGYRPSGVLGAVLLVCLVLVLLGTIPWGFAYRPVYIARPVQVVNPPVQVVKPPVQVVNPPATRPAPSPAP
jgi:hypothetical protein